MAGIGQIPSVAGMTATLPIASISLPAKIQKSWWLRVGRCLAFFIAFAIAMGLLLIWNEGTTRRQAFDANMTRDYVLNEVPMDHPLLLAYIREFKLKETIHQDEPNVTQTLEEKYLVNLFPKKRNGIYLEYLSRPSSVSTTSWLESKYGWRGLLVLTDSRSFSEACKSGRNRKTRVLHACLSTDKDTKEIMYHQESEVKVTKLGEGPNSLSFSEEGFPTMRLKCFPLYTVLLAYNQTSLDYLSLDNLESPDGKVLDTIPWDAIKISVLSIGWSSNWSDEDLVRLTNKLFAKRYKHIQTTESGKLIFAYSLLLKI